jgi:transposase-like protein
MKITLNKLMKRLKTEADAYDMMEEIRWPNGPVCPHCGVVNRAVRVKNQKTRTGAISDRKLWACRECRKQFSVTVGTTMERTRIPLTKWLTAFHLFSTAKNGIAARELERHLEISHEAAWFMTQRIRYGLEVAESKPLMTGTVESDETYIGGHRRGKFRGDQSIWENKTPVVTLVQRDGEARSRAVAKVTGDTLAINLVMNAAPDAHLMTDDNTKYALAGSLFATHHTVNHSADEYVRGAAHVNTVEGFFSQLKRSIDGTHHWVSRQHLHRYLAEFDYRYNTRTFVDSERTSSVIRKTAGKRLMYDKVVQR